MNSPDHRRPFLFLQSTTELGGAETYLLTALRACPDLARQSSVLLLGDEDGNLAQDLAESGVPVHALAKVSLSRPWNLTATRRAVVPIVRSLGVQVLVGNGIRPGIVAGLVARTLDISSIYIAHELHSSDQWKEALQRRTVLRLHHGRPVVVNARHVERELRALLPGGTPIHLVYPGVEIPRYQTGNRAGVRRELGVEDDQVLLGIVGCLQARKGHHVFLEAARRLSLSRAHTRFVVVGGSVFGLEPAYRAQLERMATAAELGGRAQLLGSRADVPDVVAALDVSVCATVTSEPFGLALVESMVAGCAVVATRCGGPEEIVKDAQTGLLIPKNDVDALVSAMTRLVDDSGLRKRLGEAGRTDASKRFSSRETGRRLLGVLSKSLDQQRFLVSHPHASLWSQHLAAGLKRSDRLAAYSVGLAAPDSAMADATRAALLSRFPRLSNRLVPSVDWGDLRPLAVPELIARAGRKIKGLRLPANATWYDVMFGAHDALTAAGPWPSGVSAVYAYEDGAARTFARAKKEGLWRVYDLPLPYYRRIERIIRDERAAFPEAEPDRVFVEPPWKQERKDQEMRDADLVVCASQFTLESLEDAPCRPARLAVIPYGFPVDQFKARESPPAGPFTVLSVGTHDLRKGTPYLLEAFKRAAIPGARLRLIGAMRLSRKFLAQYAGLYEHVESVPRILLGDEYRAADLLAFPTLGDGFGLVIQEAMCCGTPVVTTRCGGGPECIDDGISGYIIPARDPDSLAAVFAQAAQDRAALYDKGRRARSAAQLWTWDDFGRSVVEVLGDGRHGPRMTVVGPRGGRLEA